MHVDDSTYDSWKRLAVDGVPLTSADVAAAQALQVGAARDASDAIRLVAGPGTGKSRSVEERFRWLFADQGVSPAAVYGVSFTRAAANDLRLRVGQYLADNGVAVDPGDIRVSTLHSLALRLLAQANLLGAYPTRPRVLDDWEVERVFDAELSSQTGWTPTRSSVVRTAHEAFWNTGVAVPPGYITPTPPVSAQERTRFLAFHGIDTQTYAAVLPGEIVRLCVQQIEAGNLVLREVADMSYLIVDEYQDLNPMDIRFVDLIAADGVGIFAAGDDDQSIYSFRFASPGGIQDFPTRHPGSGDHILEGCFRCASAIVEAADALINQFSPPTRIPKTLDSLWRTAAPPEEGVVARWRIPSADLEASVIATSCRELIGAGMPARNIMILLSNRRLFPAIRTAMEAAGVPYTPPREDTWRDTEAGRFILGILRTITDAEDYMALRLILGCRRGVGVGTCSSIVESTAAGLLNYRDLFYNPLPAGAFAGRRLTALNCARTVCASIAAFGGEDQLGDRQADLRRLLVEARSVPEAAQWDAIVATLPGETTLQELRDYLQAENPEQQETILKTVFERLGQPVPPDLPEPRVRVLTMHGAKGLQADVVFIPGLEEQILPGPRRAVSPGLVLEGARLLYVSMTRARGALVLTRTLRRYWQGASIAPPASRYAAYLGGPFVARADGLAAAEATDIVNRVREMNRS